MNKLLILAALCCILVNGYGPPPSDEQEPPPSSGTSSDGCGPGGCVNVDISTGCGPQGCGNIQSPSGCGPGGCPSGSHGSLPHQVPPSPGTSNDGCGPGGCVNVDISNGCGPQGCGNSGCGPGGCPSGSHGSLPHQVPPSPGTSNDGCGPGGCVNVISTGCGPQGCGNIQSPSGCGPGGCPVKPSSPSGSVGPSSGGASKPYWWDVQNNPFKECAPGSPGCPRISSSTSLGTGPQVSSHLGGCPQGYPGCRFAGPTSSGSLISGSKPHSPVQSGCGPGVPGCAPSGPSIPTGCKPGSQNCIPFHGDGGENIIIDVIETSNDKFPVHQGVSKFPSRGSISTHTGGSSFPQSSSGLSVSHTGTFHSSSSSKFSSQPGHFAPQSQAGSAQPGSSAYDSTGQGSASFSSFHSGSSKTPQRTSGSIKVRPGSVPGTLGSRVPSPSGRFVTDSHSSSSKHKPSNYDSVSQGTQSFSSLSSGSFKTPNLIQSSDFQSVSGSKLPSHAGQSPSFSGSFPSSPQFGSLKPGSSPTGSFHSGSATPGKFSGSITSGHDTGSFKPGTPGHDTGKYSPGASRHDTGQYNPEKQGFDTGKYNPATLNFDTGKYRGEGSGGFGQSQHSGSVHLSGQGFPSGTLSFGGPGKYQPGQDHRPVPGLPFKQGSINPHDLRPISTGQSIQGIPMMMMPMGMSLLGGTCSAGSYCVPANTCNPYNGFIIRNVNMIAAVRYDSPQVPLIECFVPAGGVTDGVCCQEAHPIAGAGAD